MKNFESYAKENKCDRTSGLLKTAGGVTCFQQKKSFVKLKKIIK
jgi:hypothetical protein